MLPAQVSVSNLLYNIRGSLYRHSLGRSQYVHIYMTFTFLTALALPFRRKLEGSEYIQVHT